jgi:hypothetical protein
VKNKRLKSRKVTKSVISKRVDDTEMDGDEMEDGHGGGVRYLHIYLLICAPVELLAGALGLCCFVTKTRTGSSDSRP